MRNLSETESLSTIPQKPTANTVISLFTGAGGLDLGLETAGFTNRLCVEIDPDCLRTLKSNRPNWKQASPGNILDINPSDILKQASLSLGQVSLLAGGPPCQPFSKSGYWAKGDSARLNDPRAKTIIAYMDIVQAVLPQVILLENVKGLAFGGKDEAWKLLQQKFALINRAHGTNYSPKLIHLNAASYGVPQLRERVFVIAQRDGAEFVLPAPTHAHNKDIKNDPSLKPYTTVWDAIGDLDISSWPEDLCLSGKWAALLPSIPEGQNYLWHTPKGGGVPLFGWRTRFWSFLLKLAKGQPSWTIQATPGPATGPFHWKNRKLSIRELCRLQTFPDSYTIYGDYRSAHRQIGNAVPPIVATMLGNAIREQLLNDSDCPPAPLALYPHVECPPSSEHPEPVPEEYLALVGDHQDHPGTGKGPGAQKR